MPYIISKLSKILKILLINFSIINIEASAPDLNNKYTDTDDFLNEELVENEARVESLLTLLNKSPEDNCYQFVESLFKVITDKAISEDDLKKTLETLTDPKNKQFLLALFKKMNEAINNPLLRSSSAQPLGDCAVVEKLLGLVFSDCELLAKLLESDVCMNVFSEALLTMICKNSLDTSLLYNVLNVVDKSRKLDQLIGNIIFSVFDDDTLINTMNSAEYVFFKGDLLDKFLGYLTERSKDKKAALLLYSQFVILDVQRLKNDNSQITHLVQVYGNFIDCFYKNIKDIGIESDLKGLEKGANILNELNLGEDTILRRGLATLKNLIIRLLKVDMGLSVNVDMDLSVSEAVDPIAVDKKMSEIVGNAAYLSAAMYENDEGAKEEFASLLREIEETATEFSKKAGKDISKPLDDSDLKDSEIFANLQFLSLKSFLKIIANYCIRYMEDVKVSLISSYPVTELTTSFPPAPIAISEPMEYAQPNHFLKDTIPDQTMELQIDMMKSTRDIKELQKNYTLVENSAPDSPPQPTDVKVGKTNPSKKKEVIAKFDKNARKKELQDAAQLRELRRLKNNQISKDSLYAHEIEASDALCEDGMTDSIYAPYGHEMVSSDALCEDGMTDSIYPLYANEMTDSDELDSAINGLYNAIAIFLEKGQETKFKDSLFSLFDNLSAYNIYEIDDIENVLLYVPDNDNILYSTNINDHKDLLWNAYFAYKTHSYIRGSK